MFTGIVAAIGRIKSVQALEGGEQAGVRLDIDAGTLDLSDVRLGDSIAINGACMTVTAREVSRDASSAGGSFSVDVSRESLRHTAGLDAPGEVNLEKALTLADRLGGHLVSGHVDGLGRVFLIEPVGESTRLVIAAPAALARYLAFKGSITVNGVSLTVNQVEDFAQETRVSINLIPHTVANTTLRNLRVGHPVNLEVDLIARYCERMLGATVKNGT